MDTVSSSSSGDVSASSYFQEMIKRRQMLQAQRIAQGVESGRITDSEASRLGKMEARVDKLAQAAMDDGSVSGKEFAQVMRAQNLVGDSIHRVSHNGRGHHGMGGLDAADDGQTTQVADALASGAGVGGDTVSSAQQASQTASNASITGGSLLAEMSKLFLDIAQLRQDMQDERIQRGVETGQLTSKEQQVLAGRKEATADLISQASEDGLVTSSEFVQIMRSQNATSRAVHRYRNNQYVASGSQADAGTQTQDVKSVNVTA